MIRNLILGVVAAVVVAGGMWYFTSRRIDYTPIEAGVPIYPGARNANADTFSSRLSPRDRARLIKLVIYETTDPPQKVIDFYKEQLKGRAQVIERSARGIPGAVIRAEIGGKFKLIAVTFNEDSEKTQISIGNIEEKAPTPK